jgi:hypothetical protein
MDSTKLIHDFLDGEMTQTEEAQFFSELSRSDELQAELKEQLAMKQAIKGDAAAFTPATASTLNIFSELGFNAPVAATVAGGASGGVLGGIASFFSGISQLVIGGLAAAAVTSYVIFNFVVPEEKPTFVETKNTKQTAGISNPVTTQPKDIPSVSASDVAENQPEPKLIEKIVYKTIYVPIEKDEELTENIIAENIEQEENLSEIRPIDYSGNRVYFPNYSSPRASLNKTPYNQIDMPQINIERRERVWSIEISGSKSWYSESTEHESGEYISPSNESLFNNSTIALLFKLSDNWQAGMEVRNENFFQKYDSHNSAGVPVSIEQQPNLTSFSPFIRHSMKYWSVIDNLYPIAQVSAGGNRAGMLFRGAAGLYYSPYPGVSFLLTGGYSNMLYTHKNNFNNSDKFSLIYGVNFEL